MRPAKKKQKKTAKKQIRKKKEERKKKVPERNNNKKKGWFSRGFCIDSCTSAPNMETMKHKFYIEKSQRAESNEYCKDMCEICRERYRQEKERKKDERQEKGSDKSVANTGEEEPGGKQKSSNTVIKSCGSSYSSYVNSSISNHTQK